MAYDTHDPRSKMMSASAEIKLPSEYAGAEYVKFYESAPSESSSGVNTWYARAQNLVIAYSEALEDALLERHAQPDEYMLLLPDRATSAEIRAGNETLDVNGYTITIIPPGPSAVRVKKKGRVLRFFSVLSDDLARRSSNADSYRKPHPNVAPFKAWPAPAQGYRLRTYTLDVPPREGRFGRIWRCSTMMVNYMDPQYGPRDPNKMSPHSHGDFEQTSVAVAGEFVHHIRWPWIAMKKEWRNDEHERCAATSVVVIPAAAIHTSEGTSSGLNQLVDVFCPPRRDFSSVDGWVLNADEYPLP